MILASGCAAGGASGAPGRPASRSAAGAAASRGPGGQLKTFAASYLAIAIPANRRLDAEVESFNDHQRDNLAMAEAALGAEAATERWFDQRLIKIPFPAAIAAMAWALVQVNQSRAGLTDLQARSASISQLLSFTSRHRAADAAVEFDVRLIRQALGLPPPSNS